MSATLEKLDANKVKLTITVSGEEFEKGIETVYQKQKGRFNIDGFRKGKAPRAIVERHYGPGVFYEDAFEEIFPEVYGNAIEEHKLEVVSRPENVDITKLDKKDGVEFTVEVTLKPEVKLGKYEGIKVKKTVHPVTAKDVDAEIQKVREQSTRWVETDKAAKDGDTVVMDYSGSVDGVKFDGGTAEGQSLLLGSNRFIPGFEEQLVGLKKGDSKDVKVKFPEEYHAAELAGKDAVFAVTVNEVKVKELPALDDDFAQDVSEFDTVAEYKKDIKKGLEKKEDTRQKMEMENQLLEAASKNAKVDIPEVMIENQIDSQIRQMSYQMMYQGIKLEDYLEYAGMTLDDLRKDYRDSAEQQVRMRLVVEELIKKLKLEPTPAECDKRMEELAKESGKSLEDYKKMMGAEELEYFPDRVAMEKLFDYLVSKAEITEVTEKEEAAMEPAKKAPAKKAAAKPAAKTDAAKEDKKPAAKKTAKPKENK